AVSAGTMASSMGKARLVPAARRKVRRLRDLFAMNMMSAPQTRLYRVLCLSHLEWNTLYNSSDDRRKRIVGSPRLANDFTNGRRIVVLKITADRVHQKLLGKGRNEVVGMRDQGLLQAGHAFEPGSIREHT